MRENNGAPVKALLFDMDGLLLDTEPIIMASVERGAREMGWTVEDHVQVSTIGRPDPDSRRIFTEHYGRDFPYDEINRRRFLYVEEHVAAKGVPKKPGAREILVQARRLKFSLGLVTSTPAAGAAFLLKAAGLEAFFDIKVFGDEVERGKPEPDIYLLAAERIGASPEECVVFEDSESGIRAALAAGMRPVLIPDIKPPAPEIRGRVFREYPSLLEAAAEMEEWMEEWS